MLAAHGVTRHRRLRPPRAPSTPAARTSTPVKPRLRRAHQPARARPARSPRRWPAPTSSSGWPGPGAISRPTRCARWPIDAIVFALANPTPEVQPEDVPEDVAVIATGRSDYPNQINNVLAFPGIFRGALDVRATDRSNEEMKLAAAAGHRRGHRARASCIAEYIIPSVFNRRVAEAVAAAVGRGRRRVGRRAPHQHRGRGRLARARCAGRRAPGGAGARSSRRPGRAASGRRSRGPRRGRSRPRRAAWRARPRAAGPRGTATITRSSPSSPGSQVST